MRWLGMVCTRLCTRRGTGTSLRGPTRSNEIRENSPVSVGMDEDLGAWPRPVKPEAAGSSPVNPAIKSKSQQGVARATPCGCPKTARDLHRQPPSDVDDVRSVVTVVAYRAAACAAT